MLTREARVLGGIAASKVVRRKAIDKYNKEPKICKNCGIIIEIKNMSISAVNKRKFCCRSCAAKYNNITRPKKKVKKTTSNYKRKNEGKFEYLIGITKGELINKSSSWQSWRSSIRRHAVYVYRKKTMENTVCENCGYNKHIQICHIKPVSDFNDDNLISEINDHENLVGLCPNCHWEFDNKILDLQRG
ncbi:MAG: hypothetical protein DRI95_08330 [Bacteroidetes bacterium]|nr:MAG: hypothetical protein DRI95_08330 [Bacteroidota bacterium]